MITLSQNQMHVHTIRLSSNRLGQPSLVCPQAMDDEARLSLINFILYNLRAFESRGPLVTPGMLTLVSFLRRFTYDGI